MIEKFYALVLNIFMEDNLIRRTLEFYNPWWKLDNAFDSIPVFRRDIYSDIFSSIKNLKQIISITGPRRVGKTTMLKQIVFDLIGEGVSRFDIVYISMDDPFIYSNSSNPLFFDNILSVYEKFILKDSLEKRKIYFFIDEIHKFKEWELFLKKYYDRGFNIHFVISGSVEHSIVGKSSESLAGRIKNFKVYTFSFYEYLFYRLSYDDRVSILVKEGILKFIEKLHLTGPILFENPNLFVDSLESIYPDFLLYEDEIFKYFYEYMVIGGFIESWNIDGKDLQFEYLYQTQIEKVLLQDIYILEDIKNTNVLASLFFKFSENFGSEYSISSIVKDFSIHRETVEKYISLLKESNLIFSISKYGENSNKISNIKIFLIDIGIRNSILKISEEEIVGSPFLFSKYIENLTLIECIRYSNALHINYYREREKEINFLLEYSSSLLALNINEDKKVSNLSKKIGIDTLINLTKDTLNSDHDNIYIPYILFLIAI
jgi:predicted AAA+ superfamily ATPase